MTAAPTPGWYQDPSGNGPPRYWDGQAWAAPESAQSAPWAGDQPAAAAPAPTYLAPPEPAPARQAYPPAGAPAYPVPYVYSPVVIKPPLNRKAKDAVVFLAISAGFDLILGVIFFVGSGLSASRWDSDPLKVAFGIGLAVFLGSLFLLGRAFATAASARKQIKQAALEGRAEGGDAAVMVVWILGGIKLAGVLVSIVAVCLVYWLASS
ncbi:MAG: DUF2510 domain-containing protein [Bifidobacteriaceae bacterium]|jgi:hypothetical protein|nr:DUF2510 domain-containing protein [Bifidobacteriaceae bacterium]